MYLGHLALGLAAKPVAPKVSTGVLLVAPQVLDIVWASLFVVGAVSQDADPWSHGLVMSCVWSSVAVAVSFLFYRDTRSSLLIGFLVFSHWVCDFIAWDSVLPLAFAGSPRVGLGLYNAVPVMLIVDFGLFGGALAFYLTRTRANDRTGKWAPWLLVAYLIALIPFATLPGKLVAIMALGLILVVPFGVWIDRHRSVVPAKRMLAAAETTQR